MLRLLNMSILNSNVFVTINSLKYFTSFDSLQFAGNCYSKGIKNDFMP